MSFGRKTGRIGDCSCNFFIFGYMQNTTSQASGQPRDQKLYQDQFAINICVPNIPPRSVSFNSSNHGPGVVEGIRSRAHKKNKKLQEAGHPSRIKLRDYLYLAQTSSTKNAEQKRRIHDFSHVLEEEENKESSLQKKTEGKDSRQDLKKNKYEIDNSQMMGILKEELHAVLAESTKEIQAIVKNLSHLPKDRTKPIDTEMITMYELRAMARDRLKKTTEEMKDLLMGPRGVRRSSETESIFSSRQMSRNMTFIKEMFSQKCLQEIQNKLPK